MKILIVTLSNLGDVVLTLPVFQSVRTAYPNAQLDAVVSPASKMVFENDPRIRRLILYDKTLGFKGKWKLLWQIRRENYDMILDLRRSFIGWFGNGGRRNRYFGLGKKRHRVDRHLSALDGIVEIGVGAVSGKGAWLAERLCGTDGPIRLGATQIDFDKRLVVAAVGSKSDIKKWPADHFAGLFNRLAISHGCQIVLVGDKNDVKDAGQVMRLMSAQAVDLTGRTSFGELLAVISRASLVVTNDSAPLHIADSLKIPVLAIFGPTDARKYGPRTPGSLAVSRDLFCSPCEKAQCRFEHECLKDLSVDAVYQKTLSVLESRTRSGTPKILVSRLDRLGDVVLSLPAIHALREHFPEARISALVRPETKELLEGHPDLDEVIAYDYGKKGRHRFYVGYFRFLKEITRRRFDVAFVLHPGIRSELIPFLAGIPYRIGYQSPRSFLLSTAIKDERHLGKKHESEYALDVIRAFGVPAKEGLVGHLFVSPGPPSETAEKLIAIHPGSSCPSKRWGPDRFQSLALRLLQEYPHRLLVIGGREEVKTGQQFRQALGERVTDLTGKLSLKELAETLKRCDLLISNDSGPVHVGAAVGTPVISLFGRNKAGLSPRRWRPLGQGHVVIQKDVGCAVCLAHECTIDFECLKAITVEDVLDSARRLLTVAQAPSMIHR